MAKEKATNYTKEMEARLREVYQPDADEQTRQDQIEELAHELNRSVPSIRSKLVRMKLYVAKEYKSKTGNKPATKEDIVRRIADRLSVDADTTLSGLEKATKNCLLFLDKTTEIFAEDAAEEDS